MEKVISKFDIRKPIVVEHTKQTESIALLLLETRAALRSRYMEPSGQLSVGRIPNFEAVLALGIVDEAEVENRLAAEISSLPKIEAGVPMPREVFQRHNEVYGQVLSFAEYRHGRYQDPTFVVPIVQQVDINLLDAANTKKLGSIVVHYAGTDLMQFPNVDLKQLSRNQGYTKEAIEYFNSSFLHDFAHAGNAAEVFEYVSHQPFYMQQDMDVALVGCAKGGMEEEVLKLAESGSLRRARNLELVLSVCLTEDTKDCVLKLAGEFLGYRGLKDISYLLMECAYMDRPTADRVHEMIRRDRYDEKYDQALQGCIPHGYAKEALDRAIINPTLYTRWNIPDAVEADPSLAPRALDYVRANITDDNQYEFIRVLKACATNGLHREVLDIMKKFSAHSTIYFDELKICFEKGLEREVEDYIDQYIPAPEDKSKELLEEQKTDFIEGIESNLQNATVEANQATSIVAGLRPIVNDLTFAELQFLGLVVTKYGVLHPHTVGFISNKAYRAEIFKTGSALSLLNGKLTGVFVNQIPEEAAQIWKQLAEEADDLIPVAPILKFGKERNGVRTVFSRYCGLSFDTFMRRLELDTSGSDFIARFAGGSPQYLGPFHDIDFLYSFRDPLVKDVVSQVNHIVEKLEARGISHGHPHKGNVVIELIDQEYLRNHLNTDQSDRPKPTINNIPYVEDKFTFDFMRHNETDEQDNKKWVPVVRLIDFDLASPVPAAE